MNKIAVFVASKDFEDEEYFIPLQVFSLPGIESITFSDKKGSIIGIHGGEAESSKEIGEFHSQEFSAVVFIGGPGCLEKLDNEEVYKVIKEAVKANCVLGAICIAPVLFAKAGVLKGVRSTVWSSSIDKRAVRVLKEEGAVYENHSVVKDKIFITANGPQAAKEFAKAIVSAIYI